jgi:hypothetical protein
MLPTERTATVELTELYGAVSNALWIQRELLQTLLFRLSTENFVLTSGATRWLAKADDDVQHALDELRSGEVARAVAVDALVRRLELGSDPSLAEIADGAPGMWHDVLTEHRAALRELAFEVHQVTQDNQRLLQSGVNAVRETLAGIGNLVRRYDATGGTVRTNPSAMLLDEQV